MDPDAAADLLGDLTEDRSGQILSEMDPEERQEVTQLLEFGQHTAAGRMTTEYIAVSEDGTVADAIEALRQFEGSSEAVGTIYLTASGHMLTGAVPLVRSRFLRPTCACGRCPRSRAPAHRTHPSARWRKPYQQVPTLLTLAVVDEHGHLAGVVTADDVISMLRNH